MNNEMVRLKKMLIKFGIFTLVVIILVVSALSWQIRELNQAVALRQTKVVQGVNGQDGANGVDGINPINGQNGKNGSDVTPEQLAQTVAAYFAQNPVPVVPGPSGEPGVSGVDGKTLQVKLDATSCAIQTKYDTDIFWDTLVQLPATLFCQEKS